MTTSMPGSRAGRRRPLVAAAVVLLATAGLSPARADTRVPPGFAVLGRASLYAGVEHVEIRKASVPVVAHVAHVLPGAPVDLRVANGQDRVFRSARDLETPSSICRRLQCIAGVNGDFHTDAYGLAGGEVSGGRMLRSPSAAPQLTMTRDGRLSAGALPWSASLTASDGHTLALAGINVPRPASGIVLYTPAWGGATGTAAGTEVVIGTSEPAGMLNRPATAEFRSIRTGGGPIPTDGAVLSATGPAAAVLAGLWERIRLGSVARQARLLVRSPIDALESIGVNPVILRGGARALPLPRDPNLVTARQPRTLVGWNAAGDRFLVAVDGRQSSSDGMTMGEAADLLLGLGATDAVNLDGGGGTTFVVGGTVWNRPSENDPRSPTGYSERPTANALMLLARPVAPAPAAGPPPVATRPAPAPPGSPSPAASSPRTRANPGLAAYPTSPGIEEATTMRSRRADPPVASTAAGEAAVQAQAASARSGAGGGTSASGGTGSTRNGSSRRPSGGGGSVDGASDAGPKAAAGGALGRIREPLTPQVASTTMLAFLCCGLWLWRRRVPRLRLRWRSASRRPPTRPPTRPSTRPPTLPSTRPSTRPPARPSNLPSTLPGGRAGRGTVPALGRCPVCRTAAAADIIFCPACATPHHRRCWRRNRGCAGIACPQRRTGHRRDPTGP